MSLIHHLSSWLRQSLCSRRVGSSLRQRRLRAVFLRLEELEHRTTPSGLNVVPEQFTTNQYTAVTLTQGQLLAGDTASMPLQAINPTQPANATLVDNHNGTFTFTPNPSFTGSTTFEYAVSQGQLSATALFGETLSISGDTAVIGAPGQGSSPTQGQVYVFVRSGSTWTQQAILTAADGVAGDNFGSAVALDGDTALIGAPGPLNTGGGAAYVFVRSGSTWTQQAKLTGANGNVFDIFNQSIAISGDTAVIATSQQTTEMGGEAYVFVRSGNTWSSQALLNTGGTFGTPVSISGDTIVLGQSSQQDAYVYVRSGSTWSQQAVLTANDGAANDEFGGSVAIDGDTIVVGAPQHTVNGNVNQGAAYVFVRSGSTWTQQAELTANDGSANNAFGFTVEVSGDTAVVEASFAPIFAQSNAVAYVFVRTNGTWSQQTKLTPADGTGFGFGIDGNTVILGAPNQATASVFVDSNGDWSQQATLVPLDEVPTLATVQVHPATAQLFVSPASLTAGTEGQVYPSTTFTATGGAGSGYTFQESGILPAGIAFDPATGQLTGTPTQVGDFPGIVIAASDGHGGSGSQTYTLTVNHYGVNGFPVPYPQTIYAPPTSKTDLNADLDALIRGLYHSVLDRDVESASSLTYWENIFTTVQSNPQLLGVAAGTDPYLYVTQGFWNSLEHRQDEVMTYYKDFLGRTLDLSNPYDMNGLVYWTNHFLLAGWQEADVIRGFLTSPEYLVDHRADASLTNALNTNLLSGVATPADLQTWNSDLSALDMQRAAIQNQTFATPEDYKAQLSADLGALDDETAKAGVLFDMLGSSEYEQAAIQSFYFAFLRRASTSSEVQTWLAQRDAAGDPLDLGTIAAMMLASSEYRTNAANSVV